jgi:hypothetical protein
MFADVYILSSTPVRLDASIITAYFISIDLLLPSVHVTLFTGSPLDLFS